MPNSVDSKEGRQWENTARLELKAFRNVWKNLFLA